MFQRLILAFVISFPVFAGCATADAVNIKNDDLTTVTIEKRDYPSVKKTVQREKTLLLKPGDFTAGKPEMITFDDANFDCTLYARNFAQGNAVYAEFVFREEFSGPDRAEFVFNGENIPLTKTGWGYRGFAAIDPEQKPGKVKSVFTYTYSGRQNAITAEVTIRDVKYPVSKKALDLGKFSNAGKIKNPAMIKYIKECDELRAKAFGSVTSDSITSSLSYPRNLHKITGNYWKKRNYAVYRIKGKGKKKKRVRIGVRVSYHRGVDLRGEVGAPVYAMADGIVVLSHKMFYEGNMIIIDHGNRVFTYYMHMDSLLAREGERVKAGQQIGRVGSTGTSTGPHLHVAFCIRGVHVDPLSLLWLPVSR